jgi:hypothetical protein
MLRPKSASAVLRQLSPRKTIGTSYYNNSRTNSFRDESPFKARVNSVKRKPDEAVSYAEMTGRGFKPNIDDENERKKLDEVSLELGKVGSLCEKMSGDIGKIEDNPLMAGILNDMSKAIHGLCKIQGELVKGKIAKLSPPTVTIAGNSMSSEQTGAGNGTGTGMVSLGNIAKKLRPTGHNLFPEPAARKESVAEQSMQQLDPAELELNQFRDAVKSAENSILVFNLDMGRVPIMNRDTIQTRATLALTTMAAKLEEGNKTTIPCEDTVAAIDDVLSIVKSVEFFGKKTKTYTNNRDPLSNSFCTVPVKYEFNDKDDRISAETLLRDKCGIHSTTPYPTVLKECIRQVVEKVKRDYPNSQVKVTVDTKNPSLRVSHRIKKTEGINKWESFNNTIPLPKLALNVNLRKVPENFTMEYLPPGVDKGIGGSPVKVNSMEISPGGEL